MASQAQRPLEGLIVLDAARNIAGSRAAGLLAEAGARVIKLTGGAPNDLAEVPTLVGEPPARGILWRFANRGKERWQIDPETEEGRRGILEVAPRADLLVHDWTDEHAQSLGLSFDILSKHAPSLIVLSATPFGASGQRSDWQATDIVEMAMGGLMYSTPGFPDFVADAEREPPLRPSFDMAEMIGGVLAAAGCMEAVLTRAATGSARFVDFSVQEAIAALLAWDYALWNYGNALPGRRETRAGLSPNAYLPCADGYIVLVAFMQHHWEQLVEMMGRPDWAESELFASPSERGANWDALRPLLELWLSDQGRLEVMDEAQRRGVPICATLEGPEAFDNAHVRERRFFVPFEDGQLPGSVYVVNGGRMSTPAPSPEFDQTLPERASQTMPGSDGNARALEGVRILDFGHMVAVPLTAQWLALMGAEVIQVESRLSMVTRQFAPIIGDPPENTSGIYNHINCNKRSVTFNLRHPRGLELARELIASVDVVMENYSAGTMEKLGLGYEDLREVRSDLIMLSISAFGRDGPWRSYNALHSGVLALSGLAALTGYDGDEPRMCGSILPDVLAACSATLGVAQALHHRRKSGEGQHLEIAMSEVVQSMMPEPVYEYSRFGAVRSRAGNHNNRFAPHNVYRAQGDDRWLAISAASDDQWRALTKIMRRPDFNDDPRFQSNTARLANREALDAYISYWAREVDAEEVSAELQTAGVPAGPVLSVRDLLEDTHLRAREFVQHVEHPQAGCHPMVAKPWRLRGPDQVPLRHAPLLGGANDEVLGALGYGTSEIARLKEEEAVY